MSQESIFKSAPTHTTGGMYSHVELEFPFATFLVLKWYKNAVKIRYVCVTKFFISDINESRKYTRKPIEVWIRDRQFFIIYVLGQGSFTNGKWIMMKVLKLQKEEEYIESKDLTPRILYQCLSDRHILKIWHIKYKNVSGNKCFIINYLKIIYCSKRSLFCMCEH